MAEVEGAEAAIANAQKIADQYANPPEGVEAEAPVTENGDSQNNKRKLDNDGYGEDDEATRKKTSFSNAPESDWVRPSSPQQLGKDATAAAADPAPAAATEPAAAAAAKPTAAASGGEPVVNATGEWEEMVEIPASMVGKLIGKGGETIKHLQLSTGSRVQIDHQAPGETKKVTITATSIDAVKVCKKLVETTVSDEPQAGDQNRSIDCPPGIVGRIIGRGGETIRALQQASQAHIVVDQNFPEGEMRKVNITGRLDSVERASKMVEELITGEPGSAQAIIQKHGAGISKVIDCNKSIVGRVIGKGGETIKTLQKNFGANIQIDQQTEPMKITVSGQPHAVEAAAAAVQEIVNGGNPYLGGPGGGQGFGGGGGGPRGPAGYGGPGFGNQGFGGPAPFGGYGGYGGFPGGGFGGFPGAYPQAYAQPAYGGYGGYGQDPYAAAGGAGGAYGGGGHAGAAASSVWQELQDEQGRSYYYNTQTGISQWEKPSE